MILPLLNAIMSKPLCFSNCEISDCLVMEFRSCYGAKGVLSPQKALRFRVVLPSITSHGTYSTTTPLLCSLLTTLSYTRQPHLLKLCVSLKKCMSFKGR